MNTYRLCRVASVALVLAGCTAPQPVAISSPDTVLADWARRTRPLERLQFEGQVQIEWEDQRGDHMEQGDLAAWLDGDQRSSLRVTKFGDVYLWYGATPDHVWAFDFVSEPSVLRQGPADRDMGADTLAVRPAVLRMLMGLDPWPADAIVTSEPDATVVRGPALGGQLEARLRPDDLQPVTITLTFPSRGRLVAEHRWTTGRVRVDSAPQARRLARVVDLHDAKAKAKVKIRTSHAEALSGEQMDAQATVFDLEKIKAHLRPDVVK